MRKLGVLLMAGSLLTLPAFGGQSMTKMKTNPAGSRTVTVAKSGTGMNKMVTRTIVNTEGNKVLTSSRTKSGKVMTSSRSLRHTKAMKVKRGKRVRARRAIKVKRHTVTKTKSTTRF